MFNRNWMIMGIAVSSLGLGAACQKSEGAPPEAKAAPAAPASAPAASAAASAPAASAKASAPAVNPGLLDPMAAKMTAPASFTAKLETTKGDILIDVKRAWAPNGADRFYSLVKIGFYDDVAFFRVVGGFMAQVGISGKPEVSKVWREAVIPDDPVRQSNLRGYVTFAAASQPNSRTTQIFINFRNNERLDGMRFAPFGKVRPESMKNVVDKLYAGYGEGAPRGRGPAQPLMQAKGNDYLRAEFPQLDYIKKATIVEEAATAPSK